MFDRATSDNSSGTIRVSDAQVESLLERLDRERPRCPQTSRRAAERYPYRLRACRVKFSQPGSEELVTFVARTRNISAGGISLVHGSFVHIGGECRIQLPTAKGIDAFVTGKVVRCRYLGRGTLHEVSVRFDGPINPAAYASTAMSARILLAESDPVWARLAITQLERLNARVEHARTGRETAEKALQESYDLILMDSEMPGLDGAAITRHLREAGYDGTIVAVTDRERPEQRRRFQDAGCARFLDKPYTIGDLERLLRDLRRETLSRTLADDETQDGLAAAFVSGLPDTMRQLRDALDQSDLERLEVQARQLKGLGGWCGFDALSDSAMRVEQAIVDRAGPVETQRLTEDLLSRCAAAETPAEPAM